MSWFALSKCDDGNNKLRPAFIEQPLICRGRKTHQHIEGAVHDDMMFITIFVAMDSRKSTRRKHNHIIQAKIATCGSVFTIHIVKSLLSDAMKFLANSLEL